MAYMWSCIRLWLCGMFSITLAGVNYEKGFPFTTCGNIGPQGPTQWQCNSAYAEGDSEVRVAVNDDAGVQIWEVPETSTFSITALGASGGKGADNQKQSNGAYAHAKFNLTKGDSIYMVIGQLGSDACSGSTKGLNKYQQQQQELVCRQGPLDTLSKGGGGGGGGGTFVYKKHVDTGRVVTLIVAGGGGGKSFRGGAGLIKADGGLQEGGAGVSATTPVSGPGGGGGWNGSALFNQSGRALLEGALGGDACWEARQELGWHTQGGFGGGGGGCTAGGGGGGYTGGNVSVTDKDDHNGMGGSSYISPEGWDHHLDKGTQRGSGEVEIAYVLDCPCEFMCIYKNYEKKDFKCYCPPNQLLAEDTYHCIDPSDMLTGQDHPSITWITIGSCVAAGICLLLIVFCILVYMRSRKKVPAVRLEQLSSPDYQLGRLRSAITATNHSMEYNPNYDFGGTKYTLQDLREVPRDTLTLVKALGQGAFGEVYEGLLIHMPGDAKDLGVAVKTLPALCTDQAEMDFLMEALIMSKFNHPNIVRFIGVCFEKHPRFIVLELLEGGDLKSFLRAARPKPEQPTRMSMMDLVKLSMDVAKGCQYLEENHFIHRDIAARNCLLTTRGPGRIAKIADFGMARDIYRADYYRKGGKAMLPVKWMPPEAFLDGVFTSKTDVWSFGILLWEVFSLGYMPYPGRGNQEVVQLVTTGGRLDPPQNCPKSVYHIMTMCWHGVPERRPTFGTAILKLKQCLQDAEVMHTSLPVFHRVPSVERDTTLVRPRDADRGVLTVDPPPKVMEPDSPDSTDHLLGPASPNFDLALLQKQANMSPSAESLDELLRAGGEGCGGGAACGAAGRGGPGDRGAHGGARGGPYAGVFKYDDMSPHDDLCYHEDMTSSGGAGSASTSLLGSEMADSGKSSIGNVSQEETRAASGGSGSALSAPDSLWGEGGTWALGPGATVTLPHPLPELPHHAPTPPSSLIDGEQRDTGDGTLSDHSLDIDNHQQGPESKAVYENILSPIANSAHMVPYPLHQGSGSSPHRPAAPSPAPPQPHNPASPSDPATSRGVLPTVMPNHAMMTSSLGEQDGHVREVLGDSGVEVDLH